MAAARHRRWLVRVVLEVGQVFGGMVLAALAEAARLKRDRSQRRKGRKLTRRSDRRG